MLHQKPSCDCFGWDQSVTVILSLHGRWQLVCEHCLTYHRGALFTVLLPLSKSLVSVCSLPYRLWASVTICNYKEVFGAATSACLQHLPVCNQFHMGTPSNLVQAFNNRSGNTKYTLLPSGWLPGVTDWSLGLWEALAINFIATASNLQQLVAEYNFFPTDYRPVWLGP